MKIVLEISYLGKNYCGYQIQKNGNTIQAELEKALKEILGRDVSTISSGRTDALVSAIKQIVQFEFENLPTNLPERLNNVLPVDIRVQKAYQVDESFHARYSAKKKTYCYSFYLSKINIPYLDQFALRVNDNLDISKMNEAIKYLVGEYDFSCFCASNTDVIDKVRTIYDAKIVNCGNYYSFYVCGNGFLYNMVRIIMGTLIDVGLGKLQSLDVKKIIEAKKRVNAGKTVSAIGLVLMNVEY